MSQLDVNSLCNCYCLHPPGSEARCLVLAALCLTGWEVGLHDLLFLTWRSESESEVAQSCPTLCDPMDCSLPGSSVHGIFLARVLEWVAIPFSRKSSQLRDQTQVSWTASRFFTIWATREAPYPINIGFLCHYLGSSLLAWQLQGLQTCGGAAQH